MGYHRSNDVGVFTSRWRLAHRAELAACGVPSEVLATDRRWRYALLHADDPGTGWDVSWLSDVHARRLLQLLEPLFPNPVGIWLVERLQRRFEQNESSS